jgi:hypothetical protein
MNAAAEAISYSIVTDKGHHSDSKHMSTIEFWLKQRVHFEADGDTAGKHDKHTWNQLPPPPPLPLLSAIAEVCMASEALKLVARCL